MSITSQADLNRSLANPSRRFATANDQRTSAAPVVSPAAIATKGRLLDRVCASQAAITTRVAGRTLQLSGVGANAELIKTVPTRYILDAQTSRWCSDLVVGSDRFLAPDNPFLRMPAETVWLEWLDDGMPPHRIGHLVRAEPDGRRGVLTGYWEHHDGQPDLGIADVHFDLDVPLATTADNLSRFSFRNATLPALDPILRHCVAVLDPGWREYLRLTGDGNMRIGVQAVISSLWFHVPTLLAFLALLSSKRALHQVPSDLSRLNRSRGRRGKPPLLDHVEVRLALSERGDYTLAEGNGFVRRSAPRLHHVRGHVVTRAGATFWRAPHLRGDATAPAATRNVTVVACR